MSLPKTPLGQPSRIMSTPNAAGRSRRIHHSNKHHQERSPSTLAAMALRDERRQSGKSYPSTKLGQSRLEQSNENVTKNKKIIRYPEYQQDVRCLICAGFVRSKPYVKGQNGSLIIKKENRRLLGQAFSKVLTWPEDDIRYFFSRVAEAFGIDIEKHNAGRLYLLRDSLAKTLGAKHKESTRKIYVSMGGENLGGFPVPNDKRPRRFQSDQPCHFRYSARTKPRQAIDNILITSSQNER